MLRFLLLASAAPAARAELVSATSRVDGRSVSEPDRALYLHGSRVFDAADDAAVPQTLMDAFRTAAAQGDTSGTTLYMLDDEGCMPKHTSGGHGARLAHWVRALVPSVPIVCLPVFADGVSSLSQVQGALLDVERACGGPTDPGAQGRRGLALGDFSHRKKRRCIVLLAGGTVGISPVLDLLVDDVAQLNAVVVVSAGNAWTGACGHSPGRGPHVLTVAAVDEDGKLQPMSNFGPCVALRARGESTSLAAAVAAAYLATQWAAWPAEHPMELGAMVRTAAAVEDEAVEANPHTRPLAPAAYRFVPPGETLWLPVAATEACWSFTAPAGLNIRLREDERVQYTLRDVTTLAAAHAPALHSVPRPALTDQVLGSDAAYRLDVSDTHVVLYHSRTMRTQWVRSFNIQAIGFVGRQEVVGLAPCRAARATATKRVLQACGEPPRCQAPCFEFANKCRPARFCEFAHRSMCERRRGVCVWNKGECMLMMGQNVLR